MNLSPIRSDLCLYRGPAKADGAPTWTLHDPLQNKFFRLGELEYLLLKYWHVNNAEKLLVSVSKRLGSSIGQEKIENLIQFLDVNQLFKLQSPQQIATLNDRQPTKSKKPFKQKFSQFFFFRIPLFRPENFLDKSFPIVAFIYQRKFYFALIFFAIVGLFLTLRQWSLFSSEIANSFNGEKFYFFLLALFFAKVIHELGHAYTAHYYKCRVANMGIAFMVFWPVLYTETTDAWKLDNKYARLHIGAAGVIAELSLAIVATFLWSFFPEGAIRTSLILLATVTWISTLLINLNPFMRFDGYYLFSDLINIPNLQERAFRLARWNLRELLFKYNHAQPENFPTKKHLLLLYAYCTWLYRFILYLGIALLVYQYAFKLAGIILMALEIIFFIGLPIIEEVKIWWQNRKQVHWNVHTFLTLLLLISLFLLLLIPWQSSIQVPAVLSAREYTKIFPPDAAKLMAIKVKLGQAVEKGETLLILESPDIEHKLQQATKRIQSLEWEINQAGSNNYSQRNSRVLQSELLTALAEQQGLLKKRQQLIIKSPFKGVISHIFPGLTIARWYSKKTPLIELNSTKDVAVDAYFREADIRHIIESEGAIFFPDNLALAPLELKLVSADTSAINHLSKLHVSSLYGGSIDVVKKQETRYEPLSSIYRWHFIARNLDYSITQELRGKVRIAVKKQSILNRFWQMIAAVLIRESGF